MEVIVRFRAYCWILGLVVVACWGGHFLYRLGKSYNAVAELCTARSIGMTSSELESLAKQPGLTYAKINSNLEAIVIANLTPEGPDCRFIFDADGRVKKFTFDGHGYSR